MGFYGTGFYEERYRWDGGQWRIAFLRLTRTRFEPDPLRPAVRL
jgi:hypothetical protein